MKIMCSQRAVYTTSKLFSIHPPSWNRFRCKYLHLKRTRSDSHIIAQLLISIAVYPESADRLQRTMSSPTGMRHRGPKEKKRPTTPNPETTEKIADVVEKAKRDFKPRHGREWDYRIAITIITLLAFVTRFWGISHPSQVVFGEVHFGKVRHELDGRLHHGRCIAKTLGRKADLCTVRFLLSSTNLLFRRPSSLWKAALRVCWLASWVQGRVSVREHW